MRVMQKRPKENISPMIDEVLAKKKNNSKSALDETSNINTSVLSTEAMDSGGGGTPKKNEKRYMVCHEMLDTEESYIRFLNVLIDVFKKPLETMIKNGEKEILNLKELNTLFKKVQPLLHVHSYIHQNLRKQLGDWKNTHLIGKIWADIATDLEQVYPPYINSYDDILKTLDICEETRPRFYAFLKIAESKPECHKNSIRDLFIRPIQRIPSVLLLLQELFKRTEKNNPDYPWVRAAVERLKNVLEKTNESRRRTENFQHFMEICQEIEDLPADMIASDRQFIQSIDVVVLNAGGLLHKYKGKKIGLFLFNDFVEIAKSRFCTSELNSTVTGGLNSSFSSAGSGTLTRQMSLGGLRRGASWRKDRRQYKHIELHRFSSFRSVELEKDHEVFIVKIRDQKADELCFFKCTNGYTLDICIDFFKELIKRIVTTSSRDIQLEEVTAKDIRNQKDTRPEEVETILKAISVAAELSSTGTIRRGRSLRRSVSNISIGNFYPLNRIGSFKRSNVLGDIKES